MEAVVWNLDPGTERGGQHLLSRFKLNGLAIQVENRHCWLLVGL
jgi:hypothetical protein